MNHSKTLNWCKVWFKFITKPGHFTWIQVSYCRSLTAVLSKEHIAISRWDLHTVCNSPHVPARLLLSYIAVNPRALCYVKRTDNPLTKGQILPPEQACQGPRGKRNLILWGDRLGRHALDSSIEDAQFTPMCQGLQVRMRSAPIPTDRAAQESADFTRQIRR